jgi:large subunit ribosomal protein L17
MHYKTKMRHQVFGKKLNRDIKERNALFKSLIEGLVIHGKIETTLPKAKAVRGVADKLITLAKSGTNASLIRLSSLLIHKDSRNKLIKEIAPRFKDKQGGYTRMVKLGKRTGDLAEMVRFEWSIQPEIKKYIKKETKKEVNEKPKKK